MIKELPCKPFKKGCSECGHTKSDHAYNKDWRSRNECEGYRDQKGVLHSCNCKEYVRY